MNYLLSNRGVVGTTTWLHAVIKPIYGAASIGVVRVNDMQQLEAAYKRVTKELARAHIVAGALQQGDEDDDDAEDGSLDEVVAAAQHVRN